MISTKSLKNFVSALAQACSGSRMAAQVYGQELQKELGPSGPSFVDFNESLDKIMRNVPTGAAIALQGFVDALPKAGNSTRLLYLGAGAVAMALALQASEVKRLIGVLALELGQGSSPIESGHLLWHFNKACDCISLRTFEAATWSLWQFVAALPDEVAETAPSDASAGNPTLS